MAWGQEDVLSVVDEVHIMFARWQNLSVLDDIQRSLVGLQKLWFVISFAFPNEVSKLITFLFFCLVLMKGLHLNGYPIIKRGAHENLFTPEKASSFGNIMLQRLLQNASLCFVRFWFAFLLLVQ